MKKIFCKTCKFCSAIQELYPVSCNSECRLKERPQYKAWMKKQEAWIKTINPVTGKSNAECPNTYFGNDGKPHKNTTYGYGMDYAFYGTPPQYILCNVRNKNFDCKYYEKTDMVLYLKKLFCPYCNSELKFPSNDNALHSNSVYDEEHIIGKAKYEMDCLNYKCSSRIYLDENGNAIGIWYRYDWDSDSWEYDTHKEYEKAIKIKEKEAKRVFDITMTRLGLIKNVIPPYTEMELREKLKLDEKTNERPWWKFW